jgi:hypothetical protein
MALPPRRGHSYIAGFLRDFLVELFLNFKIKSKTLRKSG